MSATPTEPTPTPPAAPAPVPTPPAAPAGAGANSDPIQLPEDHPLVKAYAAQKEQIKSLKGAQIDPEELKRLRELDEASKTEAQKAAEKLAEYEAKVKEYETKEQIAAWAKEVSKETEVPVDLLRGSTKEELQAHAEQLKPLIGQPGGQPPAPGVVPTIGKTPTATPNIPIAEQIKAAEQAGDTALVMALKAMQLGDAAKTT